jgi:hypothetical protein
MPRLAQSSCCPYCEEILDGATRVGGSAAVPEPGDVSVCLYCAQIIIFGADLLVRRPLPGELEAIEAQHPEAGLLLRRAQEQIKALDRRYRQPSKAVPNRDV